MTATAQLDPVAREPLPTGEDAAAPSSILVVDDSSVDRRLAGSIIEKQLGLKVEYARNGVAALAALARATPGAILSDLLMPEMDGLELVEAVREQYPLVPVVLMTSHGSEDAAIEALRAGAASYVPKKNLPRALAHTLQRVLTAAKSDRRKQRLLSCATEVRFQFALENDPALIAPLVGHFQEYLTLLRDCDQTERTRLGIALEEAILNGLYHGNLEIRPDEHKTDEVSFYQLAQARGGEAPYRDRKLRVHIHISRENVEVAVRDEGPGFDAASQGAASAGAPLDGSAGRGLVLIRSFMDAVHHNAAGNEITLIKHGPQPPEVPS